MRLALSTWPEIEAYLKRSDGVILPTGSTEQHGPIGLIGTDTLCASAIAEEAAELAGALVVPSLGYTPAPFNMSFPGTLSVSSETFFQMASEIVDGLIHHGFRHIYVLNGHGANVEPMARALADRPVQCRLKNWWDFETVNVLRRKWYGDWEGMHATPSEIAITQARHRLVEGEDLPPPEKLSADYIRAHAGDRHGPSQEHRAQFPDGRVGSHSSLARPDQGQLLFETASRAVADDYRAFLLEAPVS
jgi:creatinine amidohydrolase